MLFMKLSLLLLPLVGSANPLPKCSKHATSTVTSTLTVTPTAVSGIYVASLTVTEFASTATVFSTTTTTITTTISSTSTIGSTSTVTETETSTSTSLLTCLSTAYLAARHPATVGGSTPAATSTSIIAKRTARLAVTTTTVTVTTTLGPAVGGTVTVTAGLATTITITSTSTASTTTTTTTTITLIASFSTTTTTVYATATALQPNHLDFRKYNSPFRYDDSPPRFEATYFRTQQAIEEGTLEDMNFPIEAGYAYVVQGFFIAPPTGGLFQFDSGYDDEVDEWNYLWIGDNSYTVWNETNANYKSWGHLAANTNTNTNTTTKQEGIGLLLADAGDGVPMTLLAANSAGPGSSQFSSSFPDGTRHALDLRGRWIAACDRAVTFP